MANDLQALTPTVKKRLDELVASLTKLCGDHLVGVVVHGSAVRGGWRDGASDVDLVCVLDADLPEILTGIGPALELARFSARIETMILTKPEIARSADCFPLLYGDIARTSVTLAGGNPFTTLKIEPRHKRLRIEQELREIRIRMRRIATDLGGKPGFPGAVERKVKQARAPLWALFELRGEPCDERLEAVLHAAGKAYAIDVAALRRTREDAGTAYGTLAKLLDAALADVDARASVMEGG